MTTDILIIGGGPAGMAAALYAKAAGAGVLLLEHNAKLGKKLYITGKGRCNVSNQCQTEDFLKQVPRNPRFLYAALSFLPPEKLRDWLQALGCPTVLERGNRVFPESQKASDVTRALAGGLSPQEVRFNARASALIVEEGKVEGVQLEDGGKLYARAVVLATGGLTYPLTGSTGIGHRMAEASGHAITPLFPSLTGFDTRDEWPKSLQGLTLKNVALNAAWGKKGRFREQGELLFTHFGISGPLTLSLSSFLAGEDVRAAEVWLDLKPALDENTLEARLKDEIKGQGRKSLAGLLTGYLPSSLAAVFPQVAGLPAAKALNQLSAQERGKFVNSLKHLPVRLLSHRPFSEAVITRGGVDVRQVSPSTMASRLVDGLYFAGEILDVDALTGGFNLQIAFATGALAGHSAAVNMKTNNGENRALHPDGP